MSAARHRVAIVGGGTAGAASALLLARAGHCVTLFERVPEPGAIGAGILLQPTGMHVLKQLGLLDVILEHGARIERLHGTIPGNSAGGRTVLDMRYRDYDESAFGLGLHRGTLFSALWQALRRTDADIHCGVEIDRLIQTERHVSLFHGEAMLGEFDGIIIADGTHSRLRNQLSIPVLAKPYPWGALWTVVPDDGTIDGTLRQWYRDASQMLGVMPTGRAWGQSQRLLSIFWSLHGAALPAWRAQSLAEWKRTVLELAPIEGLLSHIESPAQLAYASYADVIMPYWHDGRAVCLGDCAHATSPQLGQGANLALIDAWTLAQCVRQATDLPAALAQYSRKRKAHLRYYQTASRWLTPLFQSHGRFGSGLRDLGLGLACRLPFVRSQMGLTLSGKKTGWLIGALPLEDFEEKQ
ncbi:MAG TPA: NAD(P)/FAD-dependent oxidoreductase [Burkholderiaceae bacterium]